MAISKIKSVLRVMAHRDVDGLMKGIADALAAIGPDDAKAYIAHCNYPIG